MSTEQVLMANNQKYKSVHSEANCFIESSVIYSRNE